MNGPAHVVKSGWVRPSIAIFGAVVLVCLGIAMSLYQDSLYAAQEINEVTVQANILAASVTAALVFSDKKTAKEYVTALDQNPQIEVASVYDAGGAMIADYRRSGKQVAPRRAQTAKAAIEDGRISITTPVMQDGTLVGYVYLRAYTESLERRLARYGAIMLLAIMAALLLGVLGVAQKTLRKINLALEERATALVETNRMLQVEMREREKAETALRQSQKMEAIGQLSGGIAHDFNNLLMIVGGKFNSSESALHKDIWTYNAISISANEAVMRASTVTQRILAFSRRQPLSPKVVNLSSLVENVSDLIRHSVGERIEMAQRLDAEWLIQCDENQMENVVLNLAINARDAMADGGILSIMTEDVRLDAEADGVDAVVPGEYVQLRVSDTGIGMPDEVLKKAVDPFFTTKPPGQGTGLGLSMTFGFVRQSNGQMRIESEVGKGTTITILMPRYVCGQTQTGA